MFSPSTHQQLSHIRRKMLQFYT